MDVTRRPAVALLVALAILVLVVVLQNRAAPSAEPVQTTPAPVHPKPSMDALRVAREFLETAVLHKRLHYAYTLVAPPLKGGISRQQWETGNNPVVPYPAYNARTAGLDVVASTARRLYLQVSLRAKTERPVRFYMQLVRQKAGNWLVDYFEAENPFSSPCC
jgi:hypothetical protein